MIGLVRHLTLAKRNHSEQKRAERNNECQWLVLCFQTKQEVGNDLNLCVLNLFPKVSTLSSLAAISVLKVEIYLFSFFHETPPWSYNQRNIRVKAFHGKSPPYLNWSLFFLCKVFNFPRYITIPCD